VHRIFSVFGFNKEPPPPPGSIDDAEMLPAVTAGWLSVLTFNWMSPLLALGYARPLEVSDLYKLPDSSSAALIGDKILASFEERQRRAEAYNTRLANGEVKAGWRAIWWTLRGQRAEKEKRWREEGGRKKASLVLAMNDSVKWWFWSSGILKVLSDTAQVTSPLLVKASFFMFDCIYFDIKRVSCRPSLNLPRNLTSIIGFLVARLKFRQLDRG
jgi:hypothetical protein